MMFLINIDMFFERKIPSCPTLMQAELRLAPSCAVRGVKRGGTTFARRSGIATTQRVSFPPAHDNCPELHTGRLFWGAELRRATFRDDGGIQGQQIGRCNHPAALGSRESRVATLGEPNWVKLARDSSSGTLPNTEMKK